MSFSATILEDAVVGLQANNTFNQFKFRQQSWGALKATMDQTDMLVPASALESAKASQTHVTKIPLIDRTVHTAGSVRTCDPACPTTDSSFYTPTYSTYTFEVCVVPAEHENNYISMMENVQNQIALGSAAVMDALNVAAVANLTTNAATAVDAGSTTLPDVSFAAGVYTIAATSREQFYTLLPTIMAHNDYDPRFVEIASLNSRVLQEQIRQLGTANERNIARQIGNNDNGNETFAFSLTKDIAAVGAFTDSFVMPMGSVGALSWVDYEARNRSRISETNFWSVMDDPFGMGLTFGVYTKTECNDNSGIALGLEQTRQIKWQFSVDVAFLAAQGNNLVAGDSPIYKFAID